MDQPSVSPEKQMTVWLDPDLCTGCMLCSTTAPRVFGTAGDGFARVKQAGQMLPEGAEGVALVNPEDTAAVIKAAEECPGEIIIVEWVDVTPS